MRKVRVFSLVLNHVQWLVASERRFDVYQVASRFPPAVDNTRHGCMLLGARSHSHPLLLLPLFRVTRHPDWDQLIQGANDRSHRVGNLPVELRVVEERDLSAKV